MLIYDEWSDVKTTNELYEDIADMYKNEHGFEALNSSSYCGLYFSKDKSYGIQWGPYELLQAGHKRRNRAAQL